MSADRLLRRAGTATAAVAAGALALTGGLIALVARNGATTARATTTRQQPTQQQPVQQQPVQQFGGDDGGGFVQPANPGGQAPVGGSNGS